MKSPSGLSSLKKTDSQQHILPIITHLGVGLYKPTHHRSRGSFWLALVQVLCSSRGCCVIVCAVTLPHLENNVSLQSSTTSDLRKMSDPSSMMIPEPREEGAGMLMFSLVRYRCWLVMSAHWLPHFFFFSWWKYLRVYWFWCFQNPSFGLVSCSLLFGLCSRLDVCSCFTHFFTLPCSQLTFIIFFPLNNWSMI